MIYNFETLATGLPILAEINFIPYSRDLVKGCIYNAIHDWDGILGGKSAVGHGRFNMEALHAPYEQEGKAYLDYLQENQDELKAGLLDGKLGTNFVLCQA